MDLLIAFLIFTAGVAAALIGGFSLIFPMLLGLIVFSALALKRGMGFIRLLRAARDGAKSSGVVVVLLVLIGALTSLWRQCGVIAYFSYYGVKLIPAPVFLPCAFLLTSIMSYALGTSLGTASAIGVILMTIARANGLPLHAVGGAILSGLYVGDRASPASSSAALVAAGTGTRTDRNVRVMLRTSVLPILLTLAIYAALSLAIRAEAVDTSLVEGFRAEFRLSPLCLVPTLLLLGLAFSGMKIRLVMLIDLVVSFILTLILQKIPALDALKMTLTGFTPKDAALAPLLAGGGVLSMWQVITLLILSCAISGIVDGSGLLSGVKDVLKKLSARSGRFTATALCGLLSSLVLCNQTVAAVMTMRCMAEQYEGESEAFMIDLENSVITIAAMVPWALACSAPLKILGAPVAAVPLACYLYLTPLCWYVVRRKGGTASAADRPS